MKLYEISEKYNQLLQMVEDEEIPQNDIDGALEAINLEFTEKADNIACIVKKLDFESNALKKEAETLNKRAISKQRNSEKLVDYLKNQMILTGKTIIETSRNKLQIRKSPASIEVDWDFVEWAQREADELLHYKVTPNKEKIKQNMRLGKTYPHVRAIQKENLRIL